MATEIERIRSKIGDRPRIFIKEIIGDGQTKFYQLDPYPISDLIVWINDISTTDFTVDEANGLIEFNNEPAVNDRILFQYYATIWTDLEIQDFLDQHGSNINITSAMLLLAWAADTARLAKRETRSGGGGLGHVTIDTSVAARELRNTAQALLEWEREYGEDFGSAIPAEGLTEIPWTEAGHKEIANQSWLREN